MSHDANNSSAVSPQLDTMVCDLIGSMLDALAAGEDPGVVVCLEDGSSTRIEMAFSDDGEEACLTAARQYVKTHAAGSHDDGLGRVERYAIACTGCVDLEDGYQDALLVSFYERSLATGYSAYVLYDGFGNEDQFVWSDPQPAGEEQPLI
ncbi:hypothetical protein [Collinsella sp. An2]|uniref:hypothetical protein n=1 Tax=Collinsella sp. An2 TaxID=1965585 RepID=UPI000B38EFF1|nr:hypothetical protein [Collinsella sp. An2]OUP10471.1 hypothetical protein B5F33_02570 [Collinsella sp. An2]